MAHDDSRMLGLFHRNADLYFLLERPGDPNTIQVRPDAGKRAERQHTAWDVAREPGRRVRIRKRLISSFFFFFFGWQVQ